MIITTSEKLQAYHAAVKEYSSEADRLMQEWKYEMEQQLSQLQDRTAIHAAQAEIIATTKQRGYKPLYEALIKDYREAVELAKTISNIKKALRDAHKKV